MLPTIHCVLTQMFKIERLKYSASGIWPVREKWTWRIQIIVSRGCCVVRTLSDATVRDVGCPTGGNPLQINGALAEVL